MEANTDLPKSEFINAVRFVLDSTYFTFNKTIYRLSFDTPMGSPLSPIIADIVLQDLETKALESIRYTPLLYFRYVDDVVMTSSSHLIEHTLQIFNSFHPRLKFTLEIEENSKLNF